MTIRDVAAYSGVSVSTVSRVLNGHPDVSDAVRSRVLDAVRTLHYIPNSSARDLIRPQSDVLSLIIRGVGNPFFTDVLQTVERAVNATRFSLISHHISSEGNEITAAAELARSKKLRGLILLGGCFDYTPEQVAGLEIPYVCCSFTNSFGTLNPSAFSSVSIDDQAEARRAVELLTRLGHRRIGILLKSTGDRSVSELRYRGYCQALAQAGIELDLNLIEETGSYSMAAAYEGVRRLLARRTDFTALFVIADAMAVAAMKALSDSGRRVPEDCSVIAIDGIEMSAYSSPTLTTLIQPQAEIGTEAVGILVDILEGRAQHRHIRVATALRAGGSICSPA